jgi:hypothetical protein
MKNGSHGGNGKVTKYEGTLVNDEGLPVYTTHAIDKSDWIL